jgi:hypothetical protein
MAGDAQVAEISSGEAPFLMVAESIRAIADWIAIIILMVGLGKAILQWVPFEFQRGIALRERHRQIRQIRRISPCSEPNATNLGQEPWHDPSRSWAIRGQLCCDESA